ncbi:hypothetical protein CI109_101575 [Kwoniella shandongensis]|uniref:Helicase C-terminal domain-containing protein n=1 Tax=Kwoniella shandongensis TaxID=1734106 RepID=A0AAJ8MVF4_9TREE
MDRHPLSLSSILELPPEDDYKPPTDVKPIQSAKIDELLRYIRIFPDDEKTLVFSQFTSFLDHVAAKFRVENIPFVCFDGRMNAKQRQQIITEFQTQPTPKIMLISLKSGAVGLNLTAASNVFLSAIEAQAIDRVHRAFEKSSKESTRAKKEARFEELKELLGFK